MYEQLTHREEAYDARPKEQSPEFKPQGLRIGNTIYITECPPLNFFSTYFHEVGHILGDVLSFLQGDVLTPQEIAVTYAQVTSIEARLLLSQAVNPNMDWKSPNWNHRIADDILDIFSKGHFEKKHIDLHYPVPEEKIIRMLKAAPPSQRPGIKINSTGELEGDNTKDARNRELPAMYVETGCIKMLENTINRQFEYPQLAIGLSQSTESTSHVRAFRIAQRAFQPNHTLYIPSLKDIKDRK
jgi:hypothetical protein